MLLLSVGKTPDINSQINESKVTISRQNQCGEDIISSINRNYTQTYLQMTTQGRRVLGKEGRG